MQTIGEKVNGQDFDHVWTIVDGAVVDADRNLYAPTVVLNEGVRGGKDELDIGHAGWEGVVEGFTGQFSYSGHVMHSSEFIGDRIAEHVADLAASGEYDGFAVVAVECWPEDEDQEGYEETPAGWTIIGHKRV